MTGGQTSLSLAGNASDGHESGESSGSQATEIRRLSASRPSGRIIRASESDLAEHAARLEAIAKSAGGPSLWAQLIEAQTRH